MDAADACDVISVCCLPGLKPNDNGMIPEAVSVPDRPRGWSCSSNSTPSTLRQMSASLQTRSGYDMSVEALFRQ